MAGLLDTIQQMLNPGSAAIPSAAPGVGPESERENRRTLGTPIGSKISRGGDLGGFGGHGDPVLLADQPETAAHVDARRWNRQHVRSAVRRGLHEPPPDARIRFSIPFSPEGHMTDYWRGAAGPVSLFNGTIGAPGAGNSQVATQITIASNNPSPVLLLNRYPGALYMSIFVATFAIMPTGTTTTGLQEYWFLDPTGAVVALGIYNSAAQNNGLQNIGRLCVGPITDPGDTTIGTLIQNNIGIGGTPTTVRYQLGVTFTALVPDPKFNAQMIIPPTPDEIAEGLDTMQAGA